MNEALEEVMERLLDAAEEDDRGSELLDCTALETAVEESYKWLEDDDEMTLLDVDEVMSESVEGLEADGDARLEEKAATLLVMEEEFDVLALVDIGFEDSKDVLSGGDEDAGALTAGTDSAKARTRSERILVCMTVMEPEATTERREAGAREDQP